MSPIEAAHSSATTAPTTSGEQATPFSFRTTGVAFDDTTKRLDRCPKTLQIPRADSRRQLALETVERCSHPGCRAPSGARQLDKEGTAIVTVDLPPNKAAPLQPVDDVRQRRTLETEPLMESTDPRLTVNGKRGEHMRLALSDSKLVDHRIEKRTNEMRRPLGTASYTHFVLPYFVARSRTKSGEARRSRGSNVRWVERAVTGDHCVYDRCMADFVPPDFEVPPGLQTSDFVLEPLGPEHNEQDYAAWTSSMQHIARTPGYPDGSWPREMTSDQNRADLQRHADDFRKRTGFTYTVLDPASRDVIGCVYIYPVRDPDYDACALSWVRESRAHLDTPLWRAVSEWLDSDWPFGAVEYAARA